MGASTKEKGVLKLVHRGRHVEYHHKAITAAEIMRKYPRHSITRTDFFENPDIVVRPESIMVPGQVFYIVPNKTVRKLLKDRCLRLELEQSSPQKSESPNTQFERPSSLQDEFPKASDHTQTSEQISPLTSLARRTLKYQFPQEEGSSRCCEETTQDSLVDRSNFTFQARDYYLNRNRTAMAMTTNYGQQQKRSHDRATNLKSCLKKEGSITTSPNLRVTFDFSTTIQY